MAYTTPTLLRSALRGTLMPPIYDSSMVNDRQRSSCNTHEVPHAGAIGGIPDHPGADNRRSGTLSLTALTISGIDFGTMESRPRSAVVLLCHGHQAHSTATKMLLARDSSTVYAALTVQRTAQDSHPGGPWMRRRCDDLRQASNGPQSSHRRFANRVQFGLRIGQPLVMRATRPRLRTGSSSFTIPRDDMTKPLTVV